MNTDRNWWSNKSSTLEHVDEFSDSDQEDEASPAPDFDLSLFPKVGNFLSKQLTILFSLTLH